MFTIERIDHLVLTVQSIKDTVGFYQNVLGMKCELFGEGRTALTFGNQKINLHEAGKEFEPKANKPTPGSADLCFVTKQAINQVIEHLETSGIEIEFGPVSRTGAKGELLSIYVRDPDWNLIEISNYV